MQKLPAVAILAASALVLTGCGTAAEGDAADGAIRVTATTNVYGSIAAQIGGDRVEVTSLITSSSQDPHSYEASARDRLAVQEADLVIQNGGGYDGFVETLLYGAQGELLIAAEYSHDFPGNAGHDDAEGDHAEHDHAEDDHAEDAPAEDAHADEHAEHADHAEESPADDDHAGHDHTPGFNEHVWFDPHTMIHVVEGIAAELSELDPDGAADFTAAADEIIAELEESEAALAALAETAADVDVFLTEPLPGYIAAAAGLHDVTPEGFAESVEEGSGVAPATLLAALDVIDSGDVAVVLTNAQTGGAETERVEDAAEAAGIPVVAFTELLEEGSSYSEWMRAAIHDLAAALES